MHGRMIRLFGALAALALATGAAPAPSAPPPFNSAATASQPSTPSKFSSGDPMAGFFNALAKRFGVMVVESKDVNAFILKDFAMPDTLPAALQVARQNLEPQGYTVRQSVAAGQIVLRIVTTDEAKKLELSESPVSFGADPETVDVSNPTRPVTHLLPVNHPAMIDTLKRTAGEDPEVTVTVTGGDAVGTSLILTGPALKVQQAVASTAKIDKVDEPKTVVRTLPLVHLNARTVADSLNQDFAQNHAPMKAGVDVRTNSLVISGPEDQVMNLMVTLIGEDAKRGPLLPRPTPRVPTEPAPVPVAPQPPRLPELAPPAPPPLEPGAPAAPGAPGAGPVQQLDETLAGGDNAPPNTRAGSAPRHPREM